MNTKKRADRLGRLVAFGLLGGIAVYAVFRLVGYATHWEDAVRVTQTMDHQIVMDQARRVLAGGPMFMEWELHTKIHPLEIADLYPPTTVVLLFVPMSFLPDVLWWAIPLTIIAAVVWHHRPSLWGSVAIAALFVVWPHTWTAIQLGNTIMWIAAACALGTVYRWPFAFVMLKPTLAPFALLGIRSKAWQVASIGLGLLSLALLPAWLDYLVVLRNLEGFDWTYSLHDAGIVLIPVVAWAARQTGSPRVMTRVPGSSSDSATSKVAEPVSPVAAVSARVKVPGAMSRT